MRLSVKLPVKASLSLRQSQERQGHCCCIENYPWENGQWEIFAVVLDKYYKQGTKSIHLWHLSLDIEHPAGIVSPF